MFNFTPNNEEALEQQISSLLSELVGLPADSEEYSKVADQLVKLMKLRREITHSWRPSPDAVIGAISSVAGIVLILHYEKLGVVTSKALGFVGRMFK